MSIDSFFKAHLQFLPLAYLSSETQLLTFVYFCFSGLDLLSKISFDDKSIEWIYSLQTQAGFKGFSSDERPHLTMTYCGLCALLILKDDLKRIHASDFIDNIKQCQIENGSFVPFVGSTESDLRFLFSAIAVSTILNDYSGINKELALQFIKSCKSYDGNFYILFKGGYGQNPGQESHGGSTYCAIASLALLKELNSNDHMDTVVWCLNRQNGGFQGRVNKPQDSCYSFWIGASLNILGYSNYISKDLKEFIKSTEKHGGYSKAPGDYPDLLHTYMSLCGLSIIGDEGLEEIYCPLGITMRTFNHLLSLQKVKSG